MKKCNNCHTSILDDARFCHNCGTQVISSTNTCPDCLTSNPPKAAFCKSCGYFFSKKNAPRESYDMLYPLNFRETSTIAPDLKKYFFNDFRERIQEEQDSNKHDLYLERFYDSDFGKNFEVRLDQLAEEAYAIHAKQVGNVQRKVDEMISTNFNNLLDHFIILFCKDLNSTQLSEEILAYHDAKKETVDLQLLILDYLHLDNEKEDFFIDFVTMPVKRLRNASLTFLFPEKDEKIMLIADQTIFGSCKEGFSLTEKGIYWKAHFEKAKKVFFHELTSVKKEKDWITINGHFFNVSPSVNIKMMKLLRKLKGMY
ncbi:MAG: zinc ribbon domain-containing protein [Saprospiraceae bacterium]